MLTKIVTKNYRNLDLEDGVTLGPLNIFVGPNGSGKSNLIKVLKFIQDGLIGAPDPRRGITRFEEAIANFGYGRILDRSIEPAAFVTFATSFKLENISTYEVRDVLDNDVVTATSVPVETPESVTWETELDVKKDEYSVSIHSEKLYGFLPSAKDNPFYYFRAHDQVPGSAYYGRTGNNIPNVTEYKGVSQAEFALASMVPQFVGSSDGRSVMPRGEDLSHLPFIVPRNLMFDFIRRWDFYESASMNVNTIRHSKPELGPSEMLLDPSGENLVQVISNVFNEDIEFQDTLVDAMREIFPRTKRLRVIPIARVSLSLEWYMDPYKKPFYLDEMSDGTIRMLSWAMILLSPRKGSLIVIDEPEAGIHPAWLRVLAGWIRQAARETQVIVSTHSPDLLDFFTDDLEHVRVFERSRKHPNHYTVKALDPSRLKVRLTEGWQLGDLYRVGDPSVGGWPW